MRPIHSLALRAAFAVVAVTSLAGQAARAELQEQAQRAGVSTSGEATVFVKPDEACLTFGVETFDKDLDKSKAANDAAAAKLVKAVRDAGVEERHLQTEELTVSVDYHEDRHPSRGVEGYRCRRSYSATLKDLKLIDKLVDAVLKNGANQFGGIEFRTSELRKHRDQARRMAIRAAKEKAELLAGELGAKVGVPRTITEGGGYATYFAMGNNASFQNAGAVAAGGGDDAGEVTPLGRIAVRATVSVTFDLN